MSSQTFTGLAIDFTDNKQGLEGYSLDPGFDQILCGNRENDKYLDGIWDLTAPQEVGLAKIWAWDAGFLSLFVGNSGNRYDPNKRPTSQSRRCLLLNPSLWLIVI